MLRTMPLTSKNMLNMTFDLLSSVSATPETFSGFSGAWFPGHTQKSTSHHQFWRRLMISRHTRKRRSFWLLFRLTKSVIFFQTLSFFITSWLVIIWTVNRRSLYTTCFTHWKFNLALLIEDLPLLQSYFTSLEHLFHSRAWHDVLSIYLLKRFKCLRRSFPQPNQKFPIYFLLGAHHWFLSTHSWMTRKSWVVNNSLWKKT